MLHHELKKRGLRFHLYYGNERKGTVPKTVRIRRSWASFVPNTYFRIGAYEMVWQHLPYNQIKPDLLIFEQAVKLINNYRFLFGRRQYPVAFFGHGRNMQSSGFSFRENLKRKLIHQVDWWFAYTDLSRQVLVDANYPSDRITTVGNCIDTNRFRRFLADVSDAEVDELRQRHGLRGNSIGLYCGGLYPQKMLGLLIAAAIEIRSQVPDFELLVVGDGPESGRIEAAAMQYPWLHFAGSRFDRKLAPYYRCARALLMPGPVGLVIIDSFVSQVPLITTDNGNHGPEIAYIDNGQNGLMSDFDIQSYADAVVKFFGSKPLQMRLREGCATSAGAISMDRMVTNFADGIHSCLRCRKHEYTSNS